MTPNTETSSTDEKLQRQKCIASILNEQKITTQTALAKALKKKGVSCTQTTVSRDLTELKVAKLEGRYQIPGVMPLSPIEKVLAEHATHIDTAGNHIIIVKTHIGTAQTVAIELDQSKWQEIAGTLAGDDTIFIAVKGLKDRDRVVQRLQSCFQQGGHS